MSEWKKVRLDQIGRVVTGKTPKTSVSGFWNGDVPFVTPGDIQSSKYILKTARYVTNDGLASVKGAALPRGAICVSCIGVLGYTAITERECITNQQINSLIVDSKFDVDFVYYALRNNWNAFKNMEGFSSVVSILNKSTFSEIELTLPPLPTQRKIAAVLGALDDKIENNRKICASLEAQAQAIFKSWFVDFEPFGGKMPQGWKMGKLGDVVDTVLGGTPSRTETAYWGGDIAWINSGKVNDFRIIEASEYITKEGLDSSAAKLMPAKTVVLAITGATLGQVSILEIESAANQSVIGILENRRMPYEFIYPLVVDKINDLLNCQTGGAQQHINKNDVNGLPILIPDEESMIDYKNLTKSLYEEIACVCFETKTLAAMRDALLPKLMSGEIDVEKVKVA